MKAIMIQRGREPLVVPEILGVSTDDMDTMLCVLDFTPDFVILEEGEDDGNAYVDSCLSYLEKLLENAVFEYFIDGILFLPCPKWEFLPYPKRDENES